MQNKTKKIKPSTANKEILEELVDYGFTLNEESDRVRGRLLLGSKQSLTFSCIGYKFDEQVTFYYKGEVIFKGVLDDSFSVPIILNSLVNGILNRILR